MFKVVYIVPSLENEGPTNQLYYIIKNLNRSDFEPTVIVLSNRIPDIIKNKLELLGVKLIMLKQFNFFLTYINRYLLESALKNIKPDIVHANGLRPDKLLCGLKKYSYVTTIRGDFSINYPSKYGRLGFVMAKQHLSILKKTAYPIACASNVSDLYRTKFNVNLDYIQNGVDTDFYYPINLTDKKKAKSSLGLEGESIVFISVGSLDYRKDMSTVIEGFLASKFDTGSILLIAGDGPDSFKLKSRYKNESNVIFLGSKDNIIDYLRVSDFFISASLSEGLPNSVLEGMACGLPMLLSDIFPHKEFFEDKDAGLFFEIKDSKVLSSKIDEIKKMDYSSLSCNSINIIKEKFSAKLMSSKYQDLYKKVISENEKKI